MNRWARVWSRIDVSLVEIFLLVVLIAIVATLALRFSQDAGEEVRYEGGWVEEEYQP